MSKSQSNCNKTQCKTPAMILNEIAIQKGFGPPSYEITFSRNGTHNNRFDYKVTVANIVATGKGTSKQMGKQDAASNALKILEEGGIYVPEKMPLKEARPDATSSLSDSYSVEAALNFIEPLKELCVGNKINYPSYTLISDVGPPHQREFTYECRVDSIKTMATGSTKKMAMQLAAQEMIIQIKKCPDFVSRIPRQEAFLDTTVHDAAIQKYNELVGHIVIDKSIKIMDYPNTIKKLMETFGMTINDFKEDLQEQTEESLSRILEKLGLKYIKHKIQDGPVAMSVTLTTNTPFTTMAVADDEETALKEALCQVFDILNIYMII